MAYNGVQIDNSPNIIVITDSDANQITVTQPITRTVEVTALGPQGPVGPQGPSGSMAESNSGSFSITGSLTVSGSSTFTNIGPAIFSGSVNISGSAFYNGKEILTTAVSGGFVTTSSFNAFTSSINAFTASYNTGSFTGSFTGVANLTSFSASSAVVTGNVTVLGTASINTLIVNQTQLSTGSNQLGDAADDTQTLYGTVRIPTGSLTVSGSSYFSGSVGIGTTTPVAPFQVSTFISASGGLARGVYYNPTVIASANNDLLMGLHINPIFTTGSYTGVTSLALKANGNVDITNAAGGDVFSVTNNVGRYYLNGYTWYAPSSYLIKALGYLLLSSNGNPVKFSTDNGTTDHMRIMPTTGNTIIQNGGTFTDNNYRVQINSTGFDSGSLYISGSSNQPLLRIDSPSSSNILYISGSGNIGVGTNSPQARLHISSSATATPTLLVGRASGQSSIKAGPDAIGNYLALDSSGTATLINHYVSDNVWLASGGGSVAVGHNSPLARLHVKGTGATSSTTSLLVQNANASSSLAVLDDGNVGIGTTNPGYKLDISGNNNRVRVLGTTGYTLLDLQNSGASFYVAKENFTGGNFAPGTSAYSGVLAVQGGYSMHLATNNTITQTITSTGNVGIGTTTPSSKVHISGSAAAALTVERSTAASNIYIQYKNATTSWYAGQTDQSTFGIGLDAALGNSSIFNISSSGNVGIGTTSPNTKLHILTGNVDGLRVQSSNSGFIEIGKSAGARWRWANDYSLGNLLELLINDLAGGTPTLSLLTVNGSSGNIGVGTTTPGEKLEVAGNIKLSDGTQRNIIGALNNSLGIYASPNSTAEGIIFSTDNGTTAEMFIQDGGNVGIGTTTPTERLQVSGSVSIKPSGTTDTLLFTNLGSAQSRLMSNSNFAIWNSGSETVRFLTTGNVGIGNSSPTARLQVRGSGATSATTSFLVQNLSTSASLTVLDDGNIGIGTSTPLGLLHLKSNFTSGVAVIYDRTQNANVDSLFYTGVSTNGTTATDFMWMGTATSDMTITGTGNVGIGTSTPGVALDVIGSIRSSNSVFTSQLAAQFLLINSANQFIFRNTGSVEIARFDNAGNWGFGITSPTAKLDISGSIRSEIGVDGNFITLQATGQRIHFIKRAAQILQFTSDAATTYDVRFDSSNSSVYILTGSVGIGTTSPGSKLVVAGGTDTIYNDGTLKVVGDIALNSANNLNPGLNRWALRVRASGSEGAFDIYDARNATSRLFISGSGNVGIATTSPQTKLHVGPLTGGDGTAQERLRLSGDWSTIGSGALLRFTNQHDLGTNPNAGEYNLAGIAGADDNANWGGSLYFYTAPQGTPGGATLSTRMVISSQGFVGIGNTAPAARLHVKGAGSTSTSTGLLVENASSAPAFTVTDDLNARFYGNVGVRVTPSASLHVAGNTILSGSAGTGSALTVYKSGSTVMSIQGSQGELFSITDSLSGSLFSVSNISGLPILEVFSDNTVLLGSYLDPMLMTTQRVTANSGSTVIYSLPTASYDGVFVDYVIRSGSNARAGQFMGMWSGSSTNFTDNSTTDFGDTTGFIFGLIVSGSNMVLTGSASTSAWTVRAGIRSI